MKKINEEHPVIQFAFIIFIFALMFISAVAFGQDKYTRVGKQFRVNSEKVQDINTGYTFRDKQGKVYDIYRNSKGNFYIIRKSKKTGKEYKAALPKEIQSEMSQLYGRNS